MTGKEWTFQFRFWPNNNSRMYVLEGVTPCIQNMQVQAGDTGIYSVNVKSHMFVKINPFYYLFCACLLF